MTLYISLGEGAGGRRMARTAYRALAGAFTAFVVALQFWLSVLASPSSDVLISSLRFFSFFTILTNLLAAAALLLPVLGQKSAPGRILARPAVHTAIAGYILMVGVVYYMLLLGLSHREGLSLAVEHTLHSVTPLLFVIDWALFVPKAGVRWQVGFSALIFPLTYAAWILIYGAVSGWYPYPFIDVSALGYARVAANIFALAVAFLLIELVLVGIGRKLEGRGRTSA